MQIPIINGIYTNENSDFRTSYPHNLVPIPVEQGISKGYLRPAEGIIAYDGLATGVSRAGINWNDECFRVMGNQLVKIDADGVITNLGYIAGTNFATMDYSFDYLSITAGGNMYLYNGTLTQITDPDLGVSLDHIWVDGYFMSTDGEFLIVTELNNPFSVLTTKYGSSELDPDPIKALLKLRNEPHALNRYTIETFDNIGGVGFPFQRIDGAQIQRGTIGTHTCCIFLESIAFVGGGRNESISVWVASNGNSVRLATREIDLILDTYPDSVLENVLVESKVDGGHQLLMIHLPDKTLVYDAAASQTLGTPVWFTLGSGITLDSTYRARHLVRCYDKWLVGDTQTHRTGYLTDAVSSHWGNEIVWQFGTTITYNEGYGAIFHQLELVSLTGRVALGDNPQIWTNYSLDGEVWSQRKYISAGKQGQRNKRLLWLFQGNMRKWRIQQFGGTSKAHASFARLEARLEPLAV